jgi:hypothetical protein
MHMPLSGSGEHQGPQINTPRFFLVSSPIAWNQITPSGPRDPPPPLALAPVTTSAKLADPAVLLGGCCKGAKQNRAASDPQPAVYQDRPRVRLGVAMAPAK